VFFTVGSGKKNHLFRFSFGGGAAPSGGRSGAEATMSFRKSRVVSVITCAFLQAAQVDRNSAISIDTNQVIMTLCFTSRKQLIFQGKS
jgi:hypothetical protein